MSSFTRPLRVEVLDNGRLYKLMQRFVYYREKNKSSTIIIPRGFITDFATIPRFLWTILPPFGKYTKCAVLHDYLCLLYSKGKISRKEADNIFLESMNAVKIPYITKYSLYFGVRFYAIFKGYK